VADYHAARLVVALNSGQPVSFYAPNSNRRKGLKMNCEEILEDVVAFCKKQIEELEDKTNVDDPTGYDDRNTRRGLRDAYENVIERIAIKRAVEK
jgi:hypothetical protein